MMYFSAIWALTLRYLHLCRRDLNTKLAIIYWPLLDILMWGFLGTWIQRGDTDVDYKMITLLAVFLWQIVVRTNGLTFTCFIEEIWSRNVVNLFSLPLSIMQWIYAIILYTAIVVMLILVYMALIMSLYAVPLWSFIYSTFVFGPPLFIAGCWLGFMSLQPMAYFGKRAQEIGYIIGWFFAPFSVAFYPMEVLPSWAQLIARCLPMSYVFEGMRAHFIHAEDPMPYVIKAYMLAIPYALIAIGLFIYIFNLSKRQGLARLSH